MGLPNLLLSFPVFHMKTPPPLLVMYFNDPRIDVKTLQKLPFDVYIKKTESSRRLHRKPYI